MQVRKQGRKVVLIRSRYNAERKRCVPLQIGAFPRSALSSGMDLADDGRGLLPAEQWATLTAEERSQLLAWLTAARERLIVDERKQVVRTAATFLQRLADAISADDIDSTHADEITNGLEGVRKALRRRQRKAHGDVKMLSTTAISESGVMSAEVAVTGV